MSSRHGYEQSGEFDEYGEFGKYGEFDYILRKTKYKRMSPRQGYQQSGEFDECGEFGKYANLTIFCKRPKMHGSERAQDKGNKKAANSTNAPNFLFHFSAPIGNKTESVDCGHHRTPFDIFLFRFQG